jgi:hypothetical protein
MLFQNFESICSKEVSDKKCRRKTLYYSSAKALRRSRMTRGKKVLSRIAESTAGDLRKAHRFSTAYRSGEENVGGNDLEAMQQMSEDTTTERSEGQAKVADTVRNKSIHLYIQSFSFFAFHRSSLECRKHD